VKRKATGRAATNLPMPELSFEGVPVPCSPSCVDGRPVDKSNRVSEDSENGVLVPVHAGIIPHAVEAGDVVREGGGRGRRDILGSECDGVAIAKMQCSLVGVSHGGEAVGRQRLRYSNNRTAR
jgi:hypothetical protein